MKEFDRLIQIYRDKQESQRIKQFEDSLIVHQNSQAVANWLLKKAKILEKAQCHTLALEAMNQALKFLKEKDQHFLHLNLQL